MGTVVEVVQPSTCVLIEEEGVLVCILYRGCCLRSTLSSENPTSTCVALSLHIPYTSIPALERSLVHT